MITAYASGSQACTVTTEHDLSAPNVQGTYRLTLDLNALVAGDVLEVRAYKMTVSGGTSRAHLFTAYYGAQPSFALVVEPFAELTNALTDTNAIRYTIKQTFGTSRTIPWRVDKADALAPTTTGRTVDVDASGGVEVGSFQADAITAAAIAADAITEIQSGLSTLTAAGIRTAVGLASANLDTQLTTIDDFLDTEVAAIKAKTDNLPTDPADQSAVEAAITAAAMTAAGIRTALGMASANLDTQLAALAGYIDTEVAAIYNRIGAPVGASLSADVAAVNALVTAAAIRAAIGLAAANLDTQVGDLPTNAELVAALAAADDSVLAAIATLQTYVDTEVAAIKAKTDQLVFTVANQVDANALSGGGSGLDAAATRAALGLASANLDTQLGAIDDFLDTEVAAIKAKTDQLTFTVGNQVDSNTQYVNDVQVNGTGTDGDEWGP